jgi:hypothetical protein
MADPIRSTRPLGEATLTYAYPRHEDRTQVLQADVAYVDVFAHTVGRREPMWMALQQPTANFLSNTPLSWPIDSIGYTFKHVLLYNEGDPPYLPRNGQKVILTYTLWRTLNRGPIIIKHVATYEQNPGHEELVLGGL